MQTYTLSRAAIAAHLHIAPKADVRYYLNGVFLDTTAGRLASTDGACMLVTGHADLKREGAAPVILPRDALAAALKLCPKRAESFEVDVAPGDPAAMLTFRPAHGISSTCAAVEGRYPDYPRVIPSTVDGTAGNYDPALLARLGDALQAFGERKSQQEVRIYQNGPAGAAWVMLDPAAGVGAHVGIIMPIRTHGDASIETVTGNVRELLGVRI